LWRRRQLARLVGAPLNAGFASVAHPSLFLA